VGLVLLGILPATHEYAGHQIRTSLVAVPNRLLLLTGKTIATLLGMTVTAAATIGASLVAVALTQSLLDAPASALRANGESWTLAGAAAYLVLIALLSHTVAVLSRHLVPALVGMLSLVLIVSPLLASFTEHARWLPDRAGARLYDPTDTVLTATTGALVLGGWISVTGAVAIARFIRSDH
jgi:ABC-2 type transport system permease protein